MGKWFYDKDEKEKFSLKSFLSNHGFESMADFKTVLFQGIFLLAMFSWVFMGFIIMGIGHFVLGCSFIIISYLALYIILKAYKSDLTRDQTTSTAGETKEP